MSTAPLLDPTTAKLKNFWQRPEGKVGIIVLAGMILVGGVAFWSTIVPWLVTMMADTLHLVYLTIGVVATLLVVTNKSFQYRVGLGFRLIMRYFTGIFVELNPIAIAEDHVQQMKKRQNITEEQIQTVNGQIQLLKNTIAKNKQDFDKNIGMARTAQQRASSTQDAEERLRMEFQKARTARAASRLEQSNMTYQEILTKLQTIYKWLTNLSIHSQFFIDDTEDAVKQAKIKSKAVGSAFSAMRTALAIFKGNPDENEIYDLAMEKLANDTSIQLGMMEDIQRVSQNFIDTIDLQNGSVQTLALEKLEQYEQKLLTEGAPEANILITEQVPAKEPAKLKAKSGYDDFLK